MSLSSHPLLQQLQEKIPPWVPLHHFNQPLGEYKVGMGIFDLSQKSLWAFVGMTAFNPIFWNIVARNEYRNKTITKIVGSPRIGCYLLALIIFSLSAFRDTLFLDAVRHQPASHTFSDGMYQGAAVSLFAIGQLFVISSMWALGVTGTYLGDYFGILMSHRVTGFPFNCLNDPMYFGSFLTHLGTAFWYQSPMGVVLALWVLAVYKIALTYEDPFTNKIYSAAHKKTDALSADSTKSTPTTPRKSSRIAAKAEGASDNETYAQVAAPSTTTRKTPRKSRASASGESDADSGSYAKVASHAPGKDAALHSTAPTTGKTPRKSRMSTVRGAEGGAASPMRMTRSRSKGRGLGESETDDHSD